MNELKSTLDRIDCGYLTGGTSAQKKRLYDWRKRTRRQKESQRQAMNNYKRWTAEEDGMIFNKRYTNLQLAIALGRTYEAIRRRRKRVRHFH